MIETGHSPDSLVDEYGSYPDMGIQLAKGCLEAIEYTSISAVDGEKLPKAEHFDGYLIMGSEFSALDSFPWIGHLTELIQDIAAKQIPLVGICFGHQIMAQALGGRVEQTRWIVGQVSYDTGGKPFETLAYHQDQVTAAPVDADIAMTSEACPMAALKYKSFPGFSIQAHPEFSHEYMSKLIEHTRHNPLSDRQTDDALATMPDFERHNEPIYRALQEVFQPNSKSEPTRQ